MDILLIPYQAYAAAYLDDVVIHSEQWEDHLDHLRKVLSELRQAGLTANPKKYHLGLSGGTVPELSDWMLSDPAPGTKGEGHSLIRPAHNQVPGMCLPGFGRLLPMFHP